MATPIVAWGDSTTDGGNGIVDAGRYPTELATLTATSVENQGVGAQTSTQIGVRTGAITTTATVAGGLIPASGGVIVTFPAGYEPVNVHNPATGVSGTIAGVHGFVTYSDGEIIFTRDDGGSDAVSVPDAADFIVDMPYAGYIPIFWEGRNNNLADASQIESDLAAQTAQVTASQYLVLPVLNQNVATEWSGGSVYAEITALNDSLVLTYGARSVDVRKALVDAYNPDLITDVSDYNHDEPPTSLRAQWGSGSLGSSIGPADTSLTVNMSAGSLRGGYVLTIDTGANAENVIIREVSGNTVTVVRNYGGNNTSHAAGVQVVETDPLHLNAQGYEIVAQAVAAALAKPY